VRVIRLLTLILLLSVLIPSVLFAQAARNLKERAVNEKQIAVGKAQIVRDRNEIREFEKMLAELDALREARALDAYYTVNARMFSAMKREYGQARAKATHAAREKNQSRREAVAERREARGTGDARDRAQARDDRRDLRDDRRDLSTAISRANRMEAIISKRNAIDVAVRAGNWKAMAKNQRLMDEFLGVLRADLRATETELGEDRRERREDRRERRTDRRK
jgi:hypothetical protein